MVVLFDVQPQAADVGHLPGQTIDVLEESPEDPLPSQQRLCCRRFESTRRCRCANRSIRR